MGSVIRFVFFLALLMALYFGCQYISNPKDFESPTEMISGKNDGVKEISLSISDSKLSRNSISLERGDVVSIAVKSLDYDYEVGVEELGFILNIPANNESFMRFTAETPGRYKISCLSPCNGVILGEIIVE